MTKSLKQLEILENESSIGYICTLCDNIALLQSERITGNTYYGKPYDFEELYIKCIDCGFEFCNVELSKINKDRMNSGL